MAELLGAIASGVGIASFAIQLAESVQKLKTLCDDIKNAPETITLSLQQLDILTLQVQEVASEEQENPQIFAKSTSLARCIAMCRQGTATLAGIVNELEKEMTTGKRIWGKLKVVLKKDTLAKLALRLESARASLGMSYMIYSTALHRLDTHLIVTEVRKLQFSTQHISLAASGAGVGSLTSTVSSSVQMQLPQGQNNSIAARTKSLHNDKNSLLDENSIDIRDIRRQGVRRTRYRFRLPLWITNRAWEVTILRPPGGWDTRLRTYNVVPHDSPLFTLCQEGNLQGVQALFSSGEASPFDVDSDGRTALYYAAKHVYLEKDNRLMNVIRLSQFIVGMGLDFEQHFRGCFDVLVFCMPRIEGSSADIDGLVEWIRIFCSGVELDVTPVQDERHGHIFRFVTDVAVIEEIKRHAYDPPFECLTVDQRLNMAISNFFPSINYRGSCATKTLDLFTASLGGEMSDLAIQTIFNGQHDVVTSLATLMLLYGRAASEGDARVELQLLGILEAAFENSADLHVRIEESTTNMALFLFSYCFYRVEEYDFPTQTCPVFEKIAHDAVQFWWKILSMACPDPRLFWKKEMSVEHEFWYDVMGGGSSKDARIIILDYGSHPEDFQVILSWRLNDDIPEASAGDFWDMLEHPERRMPGFWDEELDSRYYYDRSKWLPEHRQYRLVPNRHERRKGMLSRDDPDLYEPYL